MVLDQLSKSNGIPVKEDRGDALIGRGNLWGEEFLLAKPKTYMNSSGPPVKRIVDDYRLSKREIIVIHDDMDIEFGRIRIKERGGDGGHLGVRSIIDSLGDGSFFRVRIGIGRPDKDMAIIEYVLSPLSPEEKLHLRVVMDQAIEAIECLVKEGIERARNRFHVRKKIR